MNGHADGQDVSSYLDGELGPEARARVELHLSSCAECRAELESLRHLKLALSAAPRRPLPADVAVALEARASRRAVPFLAGLLRPVVWGPAGAVGLAALLVSLWLRSTAAMEEVPLEPLLAAHARYSAEALMPEENLVAANYSDQVMDAADAADADFD